MHILFTQKATRGILDEIAVGRFEVLTANTEVLEARIEHFVNNKNLAGVCLRVSTLEDFDEMQETGDMISFEKKILWQYGNI